MGNGHWDHGTLAFPHERMFHVCVSMNDVHVIVSE